MSRWYIEKIYEILESIVREKYGNDLPNRTFFDSSELAELIQSKLNVLIEVLGKTVLNDEDFKSYTRTACNEFRSKNRTSIEKSRSLVSNINYWLDERRAIESGWNSNALCSYRTRYLKYLEDNGWAEKVVSEASRSSFNIAKKLGDPRSNVSFYRRGMVVGSVQSGKTANFNGVINSAIDTGYELIIVLSGLMEDLRKQTQKRIEEDVIGKWEGGTDYKGVGNVCAFSGNLKPDDCNIAQIESVTSNDSDFNRGLLDADFSLAGKKILICKKNVSVLGNLLLWLSEYVSEDHPKIGIPLLIVDDEADNASLNNLGYKEEFDPSRTNCLIRAILEIFSKKTYIGYTATPFANLLQYRNEALHSYHFVKNRGRENEVDFGTFPIAADLFPEHFIELLYPPSNYIGMKSLFDSRSSVHNKIDDLVVNVEDDYIHHIPPRFYLDSEEPTDSREKGTRAARRLEYNEQFHDEADSEDTYPYSFPESLKDAIMCFVVSIAIRYSRMELMKDSKLYNPHHTMLIHISRFGTWQNKLKTLVIDEVNQINNNLASSRIDEDIYQDFRRIWNVYFHYIVSNIDSYLPADYEDPFLVKKEFDADILPLLPRAAQSIETLAVNSSRQGDNLFYGKEERKYIAIGGDRLSRGFTLEGLTINYFLRGANTMDTLMQMGRWFGYRPGYLDCCKLFSMGTNIDKFNEASLVIEDLEEKFTHLSKLPSRTPSDFTIWIQNNPDVIRLTRANFLGDLHELSLDYGDSVKMSTSFDIEQSKIVFLWDSFRELVPQFEWSILGQNDFIYTDTDQEGLLKFVELDGIKEVMINLNTLGLKGYLEQCSDYHALKNWRIAIKIVKQGLGRELDTSEIGAYISSRDPITFKLSQRSGPVKGATHSVRNLVNSNIFKARNSTIISSPKDFSIYLSDEEKNQAEIDFRELKVRELMASNMCSQEEAEEEAEKIAVPDRAYRAKMDADKGVLIVYLIDYSLIFKGNENDEVIKYSEKNNCLGVETPLLGYALGFPTVDAVSGQNFVSRNVFREPFDMTHEELLDLCRRKDLPIESYDTLEEQELRNKVLEFFAD